MSEKSAAIRAEALESLLVEKGLLDAARIDDVLTLYNERVGPMNGAMLVAKAWRDAQFKQHLLDDGTAAIAQFAFEGGQVDKLVVVENTHKVHNVVVCTLCSCYPWEVLGLPPTWYKSAPYRARAVIEPRNVLSEFGVSLPEETEIRVWDSTAETRFMVVPMRPAGTEGWSEEQLAALVTRNSMVGTGLAAKQENAA